MSNPPQEKIEILSVDLLNQHRQLVNELKRLARSLGLELGWHYLLDLSWVIGHLGNPQGMRILDAGAGVGVSQWYLAERGAEILSVDRSSRADLPLRFRKRFRVQGFRKSRDLALSFQALKTNLNQHKSTRAKISYLSRDLIGSLNPNRSVGKVLLYNQDLNQLEDVQASSLDAVVALSALEHNPPQELMQVVEELLRVLKPGGALLATLGAAKDRDWFHEPSKGWCYTEETLRRVFDLDKDVPSNYAQHDELFAALQNCAELRDNLASFYFRSGDNGMPWGVWNPQYQSVGVCKIKKG